MKRIPLLRKPAWLNRLALTSTSVLVIGAGLILASALFVVLLVAGLGVGAWLWWRINKLTRQAQAAAPEIIDGEYTVERTPLLLEHDELTATPSVQKARHKRHNVRD